METIILSITAILGVFSLIGIIYDAWSSLKNAGTNGDLKKEIKKDLIRNLIFGAVILFLVFSLEVWIFSMIS